MSLRIFWKATNVFILATSWSNR